MIRLRQRHERTSRRGSRRVGSWHALVVAGALALAVSVCEAHDAPYSWIDVRIANGAVEGRVVAHEADLAYEAGLAVPESLRSLAYAKRSLPALHRTLEARLRVATSGTPLRPEWTGVEIVPDRQALAFTWRTALDRDASVRLEGPLFPYDPLHETYVNVWRDGAIVVQEVLDRSHRVVDVKETRAPSVRETVATFVAQGIHHIFLGPDHVLFVVGLLLLGGPLVRLLKIVTAFTLAHSVTLTLATLGVVNPPSRVVEPAIAGTIVLIGAENLLAARRARDLRVPLAFGFGLIHGFGFAAVLRDFGLPREALGWSLAAFNAGVELGQASIVLVVAPALALLRSRSDNGARRFVFGGSLAILLAGAWWLARRIAIA